MNAELSSLLDRDHAGTFARRRDLGFGLAGVSGARRPRDAVCLTLLAGAGSRWVKSLADARQTANAYPDPEFARIAAGFPLDAPRGLFPVRNFITGTSARIPLAAYAVDAFRNLGKQVLVVRGWEDEIRAEILAPLGVPDDSVRFVPQKEGPGGRVLGHGDAAFQAWDAWHESEFVIVNFGGDANNPFTALVSLLALEALEEAGQNTDLLLPVAELPDAAYPVMLDRNGLPRAFGHNKLGGEFSVREHEPQGELVRSPYTNVGIRVYRTSALGAAIGKIVSEYWKPGRGYDIPGNNPEAREFALDNVDSMLAREGRARIAHIALPEELAPAKSFGEIRRFETAAELVRKDWNAFRSAFDAEYPSDRRTGQGVDRP